MPTAKTAALPGGDEIFYTDSGVPSDNKNYTTYLMFHGTAFHAYTFRKLHDYAQQLGIRVICANRKGYPGSSGFTETELNEMNNGKEEFLSRLATLVANLVLHIIKHNDIPKLSPDRTSGGITVLGWSMGTPTAYSMFSKRAKISNDEYNILEKYVKDLIMYDPPHLGFGFGHPDGFEALYNPFTDSESKTVEESMDKFMYWVSGYYYHPETFNGDIFELDLRKKTDKCSVEDWSTEEILDSVDSAAAITSEVPMYKPAMQVHIRKMAEEAFFDEDCAQTWFPQTRILHITCKNTFWRPIWGSYQLQKNYEASIKVEGRKQLRPIKFVTIENANHFVHCDDPELFLKSIIAF